MELTRKIMELEMKKLFSLKKFEIEKSTMMLLQLQSDCSSSPNIDKNQGQKLLALASVDEIFPNEEGQEEILPLAP